MRELLEEAFTRLLNENMAYSERFGPDWHIEDAERRKKEGLPNKPTKAETDGYNELCDAAIKAHKVAKQMSDNGQDAGKAIENAIIAHGRMRQHLVDHTRRFRRR